MTSIRRTGAAGLLLALLALPAHADDWPCYRGPEGNLTAPGSVPLTKDPASIKPLWTSDETFPAASAWEFNDGKPPTPEDGPGGGMASPVIAGGRVFLSYRQGSGSVVDSSMLKKYPDDPNVKELCRIDGDDVVLCVDLKTGKTVWKRVFTGKGCNWMGQRSHKQDLNNLSPAVIGDRVFAIGSTLRVYALDAKTGEPVWESTTLIPGHKGLEETKANALKAKAAALPGNRSYNCALGIAAGLLIVPDQVGGMAGVDPATGQERWRVQNALYHYQVGPAVWRSGERDRLITSTSDNRLTAFDAATGKVLWQQPVGSNAYTPVVWRDHVLCNLVEGELSWRDGKFGRFGCFRMADAGATKVWESTDLGVTGGGVGAYGLGFADSLFLRVYKTHIVASLADGKTQAIAPVGTENRGEWHTFRVGDLVLLEHEAQHVGAGDAWSLYDVSDQKAVKDLGVFTPSHPITKSYSSPLNTPVADGIWVFRGKHHLYAYDLRAR